MFLLKSKLFQSICPVVALGAGSLYAEEKQANKARCSRQGVSSVATVNCFSLVNSPVSKWCLPTYDMHPPVELAI